MCYVADMKLNGVHVIDATTFREIGFIKTGVGAHGLEDLLDGHPLAVEVTGHDRASVQHQARDVEAAQSHHRPRDRLVAARERDHRVTETAAAPRIYPVGAVVAGVRRLPVRNAERCSTISPLLTTTMRSAWPPRRCW